MPKRKSTLPTINRIADYWENHIDESYLGVDFSESRQRCWRCGYETKSLQKCHIVPESLGGLSDPSNLVVLCGRCHRDAPNVKHKHFMFSWIFFTRSPFYECSHQTKNDNLFELFFNRKFTSDICHFNNISKEQLDKHTNSDGFRKQVSRIFDQTSTHFGEGARMNNSTRTWVESKIEQILIKNLKLNIPDNFVKLKDLRWK
jgi:hypothetical protein